MITFSVIIPTLNEEETIGQCIDAIRVLSPGVEIIVSDGGSADRTVEIALGRGIRLCTGSRGRGAQMNAGAAMATGEVFIFLHADTFLPVGAFNRLSATFIDDRVQVGIFGLTFDIKHWLLGSGLLERLSTIGPLWLHFGDSSITIRRNFFQSLGGFPDQSLFEDLELLRRAARRTHIKRFPIKVTTSARRFVDNGIVKQLVRNVYNTLRYFAGRSPVELAADYEQGNRRLDRKSLFMMVRYPEPGKVKSRLAADLDENQAAEIYRACAEILFTAAGGLPEAIEKYLYCADHLDVERVASWAGRRFKCQAQPGGDLTMRLENVFKTAFDKGMSKVVIVASDVPDISAGIFGQAFATLARHDVVIGPSTDGGYYLIGLKRNYSQLLSKIDWGTSAVLNQTLKAAKNLGLSVHLLPPLQDIDTADDWRRWQGIQTANLKPSKLNMPRPDLNRKYDFDAWMASLHLELPSTGIETLWLNITRHCNQFCTHCHMESSPDSPLHMADDVIYQCWIILRRNETIDTVNLTGGAPELHPRFEQFVTTCRMMNKHIIVRHNLTVTLDGDPVTHATKQHLPQFFADNRVEILASFPFCLDSATDAVRGQGVFEKSIESLRRLNAVGYGSKADLKLNLVTNTDGPLSGSTRVALELEFKTALARYGIKFNNLLSVTNMPIGRYATASDVTINWRIIWTPLLNRPVNRQRDPPYAGR